MLVFWKRDPSGLPSERIGVFLTLLLEARSDVPRTLHPAPPVSSARRPAEAPRRHPPSRPTGPPRALWRRERRLCQGPLHVDALRLLRQRPGAAADRRTPPR